MFFKLFILSLVLAFIALVSQDLIIGEMFRANDTCECEVGETVGNVSYSKVYGLDMVEYYLSDVRTFVNNQGKRYLVLLAITYLGIVAAYFLGRRNNRNDT